MRFRVGDKVAFYDELLGGYDLQQGQPTAEIVVVHNEGGQIVELKFSDGRVEKGVRPHLLKLVRGDV
jgi:hypothetical protein